MYVRMCMFIVQAKNDKLVVKKEQQESLFYTT